MPQTLAEIVGALPPDQRLGLSAIRISYDHISDLTAELHYRPVGGQSWPDETRTLSATPDVETQIRDLHASGLVGMLDAARFDGAGESGMDAVLLGYPAWHIVPWYEPRAVGRPRILAEPVKISAYVPAALLERIHAARGQTPLAQWVRQAIEQRLARESA